MLTVRYNAHWRTWNRVLKVTRDSVIELSLTHINGSWDNVISETIRQHNTPMGHKDLEQHVLPRIIQQAMISTIGYGRTTRLLTYDYLSKIDLDKLPSWGIDPKGIPFEVLRRTYCEKSTS